MQLKIMGSSSSGNGYILENEHEILLIECGLPFSDVKKAINYNTSKIKGLLLSHSHLDHSKHLKEFAEAGIPICTSLETILEMGKRIDNLNNINPTEPEITIKFGEFRIMPFEVVHDVKCFGFIINHPETGNVLFATDTAEIPYDFAGLNNLLIEANYSDEIVYQNIYAGRLNAKHQERVMQSHMSLATCERFLRDNDLKAVNNIVLIHLSDGNSNAVQFREHIARATGKTVTIADKNMTIDFNKSPF